MMDDVIDNVMEDADDEEETEEIVSKVLDELGLSLEGEVCNSVGTIRHIVAYTEALLPLVYSYGTCLCSSPTPQPRQSPRLPRHRSRLLQRGPEVGQTPWMTTSKLASMPCGGAEPLPAVPVLIFFYNFYFI